VLTKSFAYEAGLSMAYDVAVQPQVAAYKNEMEIDWTAEEVATNVAVNAFFSGILGLGIGMFRFWRYEEAGNRMTFNEPGDWRNKPINDILEPARVRMDEAEVQIDAEIAGGLYDEAMMTRAEFDKAKRVVDALDDGQDLTVGEYLYTADLDNNISDTLFGLGPTRLTNKSKAVGVDMPPGQAGLEGRAIGEEMEDTAIDEAYDQITPEQMEQMSFIETEDGVEVKRNMADDIAANDAEISRLDSLRACITGGAL
jgi:hypothetical protein